MKNARPVPKNQPGAGAFAEQTQCSTHHNPETDLQPLALARAVVFALTTGSIKP